MPFIFDWDEGFEPPISVSRRMRMGLQVPSLFMIVFLGTWERGLKVAWDVIKHVTSIKCVVIKDIFVGQE